MRFSSSAFGALFGAAALLAGCALVQSTAQPVFPSSSPRSSVYSAEATPIGTLLDNPRTRSILNDYIPGFRTASGVNRARGETLKEAQLTPRRC